MVMNKFEIRKSERFKTGIHYEATTDRTISNESEYDFKFDTIERHKQELHFKMPKLMQLYVSYATL